MKGKRGTKHSMTGTPTTIALGLEIGYSSGFRAMSQEDSGNCLQQH